VTPSAARTELDKFLEQDRLVEDSLFDTLPRRRTIRYAAVPPNATPLLLHLASFGRNAIYMRHEQVPHSAVTALWQDCSWSGWPILYEWLYLADVPEPRHSMRLRMVPCRSPWDDGCYGGRLPWVAG